MDNALSVDGFGFKIGLADTDFLFTRKKLNCTHCLLSRNVLFFTILVVSFANYKDRDLKF